MRESEYTASVGRLLPPSVYHLKLSLSFTAGVADSWYSGSRADLWVEWKYFKKIPRCVDLCAGKQPIITKLQQDWLKCRYKEGRTVAVIVGTAMGAVVYPDLTWQRAMTRQQFIELIRDKRTTAMWITQMCVSRYASGEMLRDPTAIALAADEPHS